MNAREVSDLEGEIRELQARLQESEQAIEAIREGQVDAFLLDDVVVARAEALKPYQAFVEQMQEGAVALSKDGTILYCNRRFAEIVARPLEKTIGMLLSELSICPEATASLLEQAMDGPIRGEAVLDRLGQSGVQVGLSLQRLSADGGADLCMVVTDMTEIIAVEFLASELRESVAEHNRALVAKNNELESFTYSVSHDMRTPLRAMVSNAAILLEEQAEHLTTSGRNRLDRLSAAALKMAQLVDDLLQYARIGGRHLQIEPTELGALAERVVAELPDEKGGCVLTLSLPTTVVDCDAYIIGMALHCLFDNACKYRRGEGPAKIEFGMEVQDHERVFFVRDEGIGFNMAYVKKLFIPFERLHRDSEYMGTGIGLANVKRAFERHDGRVWAEGEVDKGSTFYFTLGAVAA